jgi:hypothetical protein
MFVWREGRKRLNREVPPPNWLGTDTVEDSDCRSLLALSQRVGTAARVQPAKALKNTER